VLLVKDTDHRGTYLRQAYRRVTVHNDDTFVDKKTEWVLMMKFGEANAIGGGSRYLHDLSASTEALSTVREVPVPVGELVVVNNDFWLQDRAPFKPHPQLHRKLRRQRGTFSR
jgi:hypothetical protein